METHEPNTSAKMENIASTEFFHSLHLYRPKWPSQHEIVSMAAGTVTPRMEKNTEPTSEMKGSRFGIRQATATEKKTEIDTIKLIQ